MGARVGLLGPLLAASLCAQTFESWHATDLLFLPAKSWDLTAHTQFRTTSRFSTVPYVRVGPVLRFRPRPWLALQGGYWLQEGRSFEGWRESQRVFAHLEVPVARVAGVSLLSRHGIERFFVDDGPGFTRHRHRVQAVLPWRLRPTASNELFFDRDGLLSTRPGLTLRFPVRANAQLDVAYLYDIRRATSGGPRHVLQTTLRVAIGAR